MNDRKVILLGSGGHAEVLFDVMQLCGIVPVGLIDPGREKNDTGFHGLACIGGDDALLSRDPAQIVLVNGIGSSSRPRQRHAIFEKFSDHGFKFLTLIHPSAVIAKSAIVGEGAQIMAGCIVQPFAEIGANTIINTRAGIDHHSVIGTSTHIAPGVTVCGAVKIGEISHIGAGTTVIQGIKIGSQCLVGAGVTVKKDLAAQAALLA